MKKQLSEGNLDLFKNLQTANGELSIAQKSALLEKLLKDNTSPYKDPAEKVLNNFHMAVVQNAKGEDPAQLTSKVYADLTPSEKVWVKKKVIDADLKAYETVGITMTTPEKKDFMYEVAAELKEDYKNKSYLTLTLAYLSGEEPVRFIEDGLTFHGLMRNYMENTNVGKISEMTVEEIKTLIDPTIDMIKRLEGTLKYYNEFVRLCEDEIFKEGGTSRYETNKSPVINNLALIYWKNKFRKIQDTQLTSQQIADFKALLMAAGNHKTSQGGWKSWIGSKVSNNSRAYNLANSFEKFANKVLNLKNQNQ